MIRIRHLRKEYPTATPLKDVNVDIHKGDIHIHILQRGRRGM